MNFGILQARTCYSILSSLNKIGSLVKKAKSLGYTSLAITDKDNMFGTVEFYKECLKEGIKPIIGLNLTTPNGEILLYAMNNLGYKNLAKLSTFVSDREITYEDLETYKDNLILIMPFSYYDEKIYNLYEIKFIGYSTLEEKEKINDKKIFINDISYLEKNEHEYLDYLLMIRDAKVLGEYEFGTNKNKHILKTTELKEICDLEDINNISYVSLNCNVKIEYTPGLLPIYDNTKDGFEYLTYLCHKGLNKRLNGDIPDEYKERLNYELDIIKKMGFCDYFLVVYDYVKFAKARDILVGPGRGSAAGSLVSYVIGITDIDPIKYDLLFERFLNPERITMPDIDIDFDDIRRSEVIDYVINKYGEKKAVGIISFNTLAAKQVIRDVSRVMKIEMYLVDTLCKNVTEKTLQENYNNNSKFKSIINSSDELKKMFEIAIHFEGNPRHISIHAAGVVISSRNIDEIVPLYKNPIGIYTTAYSKYHIEELGLLKMDMLGLSNLSLISDVIKNIKENENININFNNIPYEDKGIFKLFSDVDTDGIFQFESPGMKKFLRKLKIRNFEEIVAAISLYRPGPMPYIDTYIKRRNTGKDIDCIHEDLKEILMPTYGIIIYQEQIMKIAKTLAGYSLGEADVLRRAISNKKEDVLIKEREKFTKKSVEKGYTLELSNKVYDMIVLFANFGFNRSHAVSYSIIAAKMAYLKAYFYKYFIVGILNNDLSNLYKTKNYITDSNNKGIPILKPNINKSTDKYITSEEGIIAPLSIIHSVGNVIVDEIINKRKDGYTSFIDFMQKVNNSLINQKIASSLILSGAFDKLGYNKKTLIENLDIILNYVFLTSDNTLFEVPEPVLTIYEEYDKDYLIKSEEEIFGFYISNHPVTKYRTNKDINTNQLEDNFNKYISSVLIIDRIKEVITKKNDVMAFVTASDDYGTVSITLFPDTYKEANNINKKDIIRVYGRVEKKFDEYQIAAKTLEILESSSK